MIKGISEITKSDPQVQRLLGTAREYAEIYLLVMKRRKGCDGMGELAMVKEELVDSLHELTEYCKRQGYLCGDVQDDVDCMANELTGLFTQE